MHIRNRRTSCSPGSPQSDLVIDEVSRCRKRQGAALRLVVAYSTSLAGPMSENRPPGKSDSLAGRDQAVSPWVNINSAQLFHCATNDFSYKRPTLRMRARRCGRYRQLVHVSKAVIRIRHEPGHCRPERPRTRRVRSSGKVRYWAEPTFECPPESAVERP
jgi:hypothetical protein